MSASYEMYLNKNGEPVLVQIEKRSRHQKTYPRGTKFAFDIPKEDRSTDLATNPEYKADNATIGWYVESI